MTDSIATAVGMGEGMVANTFCGVRAWWGTHFVKSEK
jgi:hypothetical protein